MISNFILQYCSALVVTFGSGLSLFSIHNGFFQIIQFEDNQLISDNVVTQNCTDDEIRARINEFKSSTLQYNSIRQLVYSCGKSSIPILTRSLQEDPLPTTRSAIAESLAYIGGVDAVNALILALDNDIEPSVRRKSASALGYLRDLSAINSLVVILKQENQHIEIRKASAEALGEIGGKLATDNLIDSTRDVSAPLALRNISAQALEKIGEPAIDSLVELLDDSNLQTRYYTVRTLSKINSFRSNNALKTNQQKVIEILEAAYASNIIEFDRVPASTAGQGTKEAFRKPLFCNIEWFAQYWGRCRS